MNKFTLIFSFILFIEAVNFERKYVPVNYIEKEALTVAAVGDISFGSDNSKFKTATDSILRKLEAVSNILRLSDVNIFNCEGVFIDSNISKKSRFGMKQYVFGFPENYASFLKYLGFNFASLANNHINDYNDDGRRHTKTVLEKKNIIVTGIVEIPFRIVPIKGMKIGFASFSFCKNTNNYIDKNNVAQIIQFLNNNSDIVIVSVHSGREGENAQRIFRKNEYIGSENRGNVYEFAHYVIDLGADLIIGHGPHVPRALELYKNRLIAYSLGNFFTYGDFFIGGASALAPLLKVKLDGNGKFVGGEIYSFMQDQQFNFSADKFGRAFNAIQKLSKSDFPESKLTFGSDGKINTF